MPGTVKLIRSPDLIFFDATPSARSGNIYRNLQLIANSDKLHAMQLISNKALRDFATNHPDADSPLRAFRIKVEKGHFANFAALRATFKGVDKVGERFVFNIGGNKYRLVVEIQYRAGIAWVKFIGSHAQYDRIDVESVNDN